MFLKAARRARKLLQQFEVLCDSADAYRPGPPLERYRPPFSAEIVLHMIADKANALGVKSGDSGEIAVAMVTRIDSQQSYDQALLHFLADWEHHRISAVNGRPLAERVAHGQALAVAETVAYMTRYEALAEALNRPHPHAPRGVVTQALSKEVTPLLHEYAHLREHAYLVRQFERRHELETELESRGIDVVAALGPTPPFRTQRAEDE